jgi:hypothetical protein
MKLTDEAMTVLEESECLRENMTLDRRHLTRLIIDELTENHVAHSMSEIDRVQITAGQLTETILNSDLPELVDLVKSFLPTGYNAPVQKELNGNGYMLCPGNFTIEAEVSGEIKKAHFTTRFLSDDPTVIQIHLLDRITNRAENTANSSHRLGELVVERRPEMSEAVTTWRDKLEMTFRRALGGSSK